MSNFLEKLKNIFLIIFLVVIIYSIVTVVSYYKEQKDMQFELETLEKETKEITEKQKKAITKLCLLDLHGFDTLEECEKKIYLGNGKFGFVRKPIIIDENLIN